MGSFLIGYVEVRYSLLYYVLLIKWMMYNKKQTNKGDKGGTVWPGIKLPRQADT